MNTKNNINTKESDDIDLSRFIGEIIDHWKIIFSVTCFFALVGIIYAFFASPVFQADALVQVEQKQGNAILNNLSQMLPDSQPQSAPEIALLRSRMILGKTVDDLNLQTIVSQNYFPVFGKGWARLMGEKPGNVSISRIYVDDSLNKEPSIKVHIFNNEKYELMVNGESVIGKVGNLLDFNGVTIKIDKVNAEPNTSFDIKYISKLSAITNLQDVFNVSDQGKDTGMLNLTLTGNDPGLIENILDNITSNYLAQNISRQAAQDEKSLEFLNQQLPKVRSDLDEAENKLNVFRRKNDSVDLSLEAKSVLDQIVNVDNQLNELTFRESEISQLYTKEHPTYKALMEKRKTLQDEKQKLNKRVSNMPETQQEILRLSRDVESGRAVYMQLLNRQQELNIAKSSAIGNVRIIDNALTKTTPVKPKKILVIIFSIVIGAIVSISLVLARAFLRRGIDNPEKIEELGLNVYASIPVAESVSKKGINNSDTQPQEFLSLSNPADLAIEAIRGLRTSLHFAMMEARNNVLMISGASPNVGKTFICSNLAAVIAQSGKKVLLIDADMRKGYTHKIFGVANNNGLSDVLAGKSNYNQAIKHIERANFDFISRGITPPNPAELLMHKRFGDLIKLASENYDIIILDTPPILAVTDAAIIGGYAGTTFLVARFEVNTAKEIEVSVKRFENSGVRIKGCILNCVVKKASNYYAYGYSDYGYSYKDANK